MSNEDTDKSRSLSYLLYLEDDAIEIHDSMTLGNHLNNDIIVPGEDVLDYHLRIEMNERGPVAIPLGEATASVNGTEVVEPQPLMLGDVVTIGQTTLQVGVEFEVAAEAESWWLVGADDQARYRVEGELNIGRSDNQDIVLRDEHISRHHARLIEKQGYVWLQDLGSANGCYVNDQRIQGGVALFHGDYIKFDNLAYQLLGEGGDLTPVRNFSDALRPTARPAPSYRHDTTEVAPIAVESLSVEPRQKEIDGVGAFLLAASDGLDKEVYQLPIGESSIGRGVHNQIVITDASVSASHATIHVSPDQVSITNLLATNGTRVNGEEVNRAHLADGDVVHLGRICFIYKEIPPGDVKAHPFFGKLRIAILAGIGLSGLLLLWLSLT